MTAGIILPNARIAAHGLPGCVEAIAIMRAYRAVVTGASGKQVVIRFA